MNIGDVVGKMESIKKLVDPEIIEKLRKENSKHLGTKL
jgi:hypothetical protein